MDVMSCHSSLSVMCAFTQTANYGAVQQKYLYKYRNYSLMREHSESVKHCQVWTKCCSILHMHHWSS